jgi:hypothetical protein
MYGIEVPFNGTTSLLNFIKKYTDSKVIKETHKHRLPDGRTDSRVISYASACLKEKTN